MKTPDIGAGNALVPGDQERFDFVTQGYDVFSELNQVTVSICY